MTATTTIRTIDPTVAAPREFYGLMASVVVPRPIAWVGTVSRSGVANVAPYSFFNIASVDPPILSFSCLNNMRDGRQKNTQVNLVETGQCAIHIVPFELLHRQNLTAVEFDADVSELERARLTPRPSTVIDVPLIGESPVQLECRLRDVIALGDGPGAGNLMLVDVVMLHVDERLFAGAAIDPRKLEVVGRLGGDSYVHVSPANVISVGIPGRRAALGIDGLLPEVVASPVFSEEELAQLAMSAELPYRPPLPELAERRRAEIAEESDHGLLSIFRAAHRGRCGVSMLASAFELADRGYSRADVLFDQAASAALRLHDLPLACVAAGWGAWLRREDVTAAWQPSGALALRLEK